MPRRRRRLPQLTTLSLLAGGSSQECRRYALRCRWHRRRPPCALVRMTLASSLPPNSKHTEQSCEAVQTIRTGFPPKYNPNLRLLLITFRILAARIADPKTRTSLGGAGDMGPELCWSSCGHPNLPPGNSAHVAADTPDPAARGASDAPSPTARVAGDGVGAPMKPGVSSLRSTFLRKP